MEWPDGWSPIEDPEEGRVLKTELQRELKPGHPLFGLPVTAIARRYDQDDVLFELRDESERVAEVHLSYAGNNEDPFPCTTIFEKFRAWADSVCKE